MPKFKYNRSGRADTKSPSSAMNKDALTEAIRNIARKLYEEKGCQPGHDLDNWLEAERLVKSGKV